jgi:lipoate-protein ligase A
MTWDFLESPPGDAAWNMALDEALFLGAAQRCRPLLRVYGWAKPSVSIGYFQKFPAELEGRYQIVRRPTGGGLVYHGEDTTFTVIVPPGHELQKLRAREGYCRIHEAVANSLDCGSALLRATPQPVTLEKALPQYDCFQRPVAGDVIMDGRKFAGGAQRRSKHGMLHQGSIARRISADRLARAFGETFSTKVQTYAVPPEVNARAELLVREKYLTNAWNRRVI